MVRTIELKSEGAAVRIEVDADGWSRCFLAREGVPDVFLGNDDIARIGRRLTAALCRGEEGKTWDYLGHKVRWVISLGAAHCTLYVTTDSPEQLLIWQDVGAAVICTSKFPPALRERWCEQLRGLGLGPDGA